MISSFGGGGGRWSADRYLGQGPHFRVPIDAGARLEAAPLREEST